MGHLLDAAKLTKRDLALIKAADGGKLDDEDAARNAFLDLAEQLEGQPGCPGGRGEPTLDREDKCPVQKHGGMGGLPTSSGAVAPPPRHGQAGRGRRFFGNCRRVRDAILEDADTLNEEMAPDDDGFLDFVNALNEDGMDED